MKKTLLFIYILLVLSITLIYADTSKKSTQDIIGFIGSETHFEVEGDPLLIAESGNKKGINLDYTDSTNTARYLIAPTTNILSQAGLEIGHLSMIVASINNTITTVKLKIKHTQLTKNDDPTVKVDYELALKYAVSRNTSSTITQAPVEFCLSEDSTNPYISASQKAITLTFLLAKDELMAIHNAGIYFRLTKDSPVSIEGQYYSIATFELEVE